MRAPCLCSAGESLEAREEVFSMRNLRIAKLIILAAALVALALLVAEGPVGPY